VSGIPAELRPFETYIVSYSGGKDSTATLLWSLENLPRERLQVVFADTGVEWPETLEYLNYIERELGVSIDRIRAGDRPFPPKRNGEPREELSGGSSMYELVRLRGRWPAPRYRYCTTYLKRYPLLYYQREFENPVSIEGTRAEESKSRANKAWFDPKGDKTTIPICRPVLRWTEREVWEYLRAHGILPNPVYNYATRCGCWCCIMARRAEVLNFCRIHPELAREAADVEAEIGHRWTARQSIGGLLARARAQMELFEHRPRFSETGVTG